MLSLFKHKVQFWACQTSRKKFKYKFGNSKIYFSISELEPAKDTTEKLVVKHAPVSSLKASNVSSEINLLGYNVEEATVVIDKYLDDCVLAGLPTIRIVHGKGTGALRTGIHVFLKKHPHVKSFRLGTFGEGEMGVTVVELK